MSYADFLNMPTQIRLSVLNMISEQQKEIKKQESLKNK